MAQVLSRVTSAARHRLAQLHHLARGATVFGQSAGRSERVSDLFAVEMSLHGWIALGIAVFGIVALNVGLMHLAQRRHDGEYRPPERKRRDEET
jgi:hypothetical protein